MPAPDPNPDPLRRPERLSGEPLLSFQSLVLPLLSPVAGLAAPDCLLPPESAGDWLALPEPAEILANALFKAGCAPRSPSVLF